MIKEISIEYIYNSGFVLGFEDRDLVFDYYLGKLPEIREDSYIFVSHAHKDHYNPQIFEQKNSHSFSYFLSDDLLSYEKEGNVINMGDMDALKDPRPSFTDRIHYLGEYDKLDFDHSSLKIKTFPSTDQGLSFLINYDGVSIFHAGDLNLWIWDDDTEEEKIEMEERFKEIVEMIAPHKVDIAFFPLDPRLGDLYADGFNYFVDKVKPAIIFPMHFGDTITNNLSYINEFEENKYIFRPILKSNQTFLVNYQV